MCKNLVEYTYKFTILGSNPLTKEDAMQACTNMGWTVKWTSAKSLVCTKGSVAKGDNCNKCDTWRLLVWKDGGTDMSPDGQTYKTKAGRSYGGHSPCKGGWNLPECDTKWGNQIGHSGNLPLGMHVSGILIKSN